MLPWVIIIMHSQLRKQTTFLTSLYKPGKNVIRTTIVKYLLPVIYMYKCTCTLLQCLLSLPDVSASQGAGIAQWYIVQLKLHILRAFASAHLQDWFS